MAELAGIITKGTNPAGSCCCIFGQVEQIGTLGNGIRLGKLRKRLLDVALGQIEIGAAAKQCRFFKASASAAGNSNTTLKRFA